MEQDGSFASYAYDDLYQLTSETRTGTNSYSITYQYDDVGNRTQMVKNGTTTTYTYNSNNQLITELTNGVTTTYDYDNNGNQISKTDAEDSNNNVAYAWDWNNRLVSVSEADGNTVYEYNGDGTRISKTQDEVKTKYINDVARGLVQVLMETTDTNIVQASYTYGNDLISAQIGEIRGYYHYDGLGTTRQLTDNSGTVTKSYTYDSFGNVIASIGTSDNTYGFTGEQQFGEADNLVFLRARYYEPEIGRFISRDPLDYIDSMSLYAYVKSNPIILIDPYGLACGPGKIGDIIFPDGPFEEACQKHDDCYGATGGYSCSTPKSDCDNEFCNNMAAVCSKMSGLKKYSCKAIAKAYCVAVKKGGQSSFDSARKAADCPSDCKK